MTEEYIDRHYGDIVGHESEVEARLIEADFNVEGLKKDNRSFIDTFSAAGERVVLIEDDYNATLAGIL
jgi:hypothetical protein